MHRVAVVLLASVFVGTEARAQIGRRPPPTPEPKAWMSLSVGVMEISDVHDGSTQSDWRFGNAGQDRVSLEMAIQNQSTIGITGSFARVPPPYTPGGLTVGGSFSFDADAPGAQLMVAFH